jgi:hypothetical protein
MRCSPRHGGVVAGVLIGLLVLVVVVGAGLMLTGMYVAKNVKVIHKDLHGEQTTVETPFGTLRVRERARLDPRQMGMPVYPGATRVDDNKLASFEFDAGDTHKAISIAGAEFTTTDSFEEVRDFYRQELPHWMVAAKPNGGVQFEFTQGGYRKIIAIHHRDGETHIGLASIGEPAAN